MKLKEIIDSCIPGAILGVILAAITSFPGQIKLKKPEEPGKIQTPVTQQIQFPRDMPLPKIDDSFELELAKIAFHKKFDIPGEYLPFREGTEWENERQTLEYLGEQCKNTDFRLNKEECSNIVDSYIREELSWKADIAYQSLFCRVAKHPETANTLVQECKKRLLLEEEIQKEIENAFELRINRLINDYLIQQRNRELYDAKAEASERKPRTISILKDIEISSRSLNSKFLECYYKTPKSLDRDFPTAPFRFEDYEIGELREIYGREQDSTVKEAYESLFQRISDDREYLEGLEKELKNFYKSK